MIKYFLIFIMCFKLASSNENVVKTSELELFLFKIGFESLLNDVKITKDKTSLNEREIGTINEKIELIMAELYKNNRVLLNDSSENSLNNSETKKQLNSLRSEIEYLKEEIQNLKKKEKKETFKDNSALKVKEIIKITKANEKKVASSIANIYAKPFNEAKVLRKLKRNDLIFIESCNKFGWCKLENKEEFIKSFLIR